MDGDDEVSSARRHSASVTTETPPRSPTLVVTCPGSAFPLPAPATQQDSMHRALMILARDNEEFACLKQPSESRREG